MGNSCSVPAASDAILFMLGGFFFGDRSAELTFRITPVG